MEYNIIEVDSFDVPELDVYARLSERQLMRINEPGPGLCIVESIKVIERALEDGYEPVSFLIETEKIDEVLSLITEYCETAEILIYTAKLGILTELVGYNLTGGVLCAMKRRQLPTLDELLVGTKRIAVLDEVENPTNVGAIMRSAAALMVDCVILTGGSSDPLYRRAARVSMGTVFQIPWTVYSGNSAELIVRLRGLGYKCLATALDDRSIKLGDPVLKGFEKVAIVLGSEGYGLPQDTIDACDRTVMIPMRNGVDSLNVAAAAAVVFWEI